MLRSSREGRKQAARFHSNVPSSSSSIAISSFYNDNRSNNKKNANDDGHENIDVTFVDRNGFGNDQSTNEKPQSRKSGRGDDMLQPKSKIAKHSRDKIESNQFRSSANS